MLNIFLWGTGIIAKKVIRECEINSGCNILGFIDNDETKWGKSLNGIEIFSPDILQEKECDRVVILASQYDEIKKQIVSIKKPVDVMIDNQYFFYKKGMLVRYGNTKDNEIREVLNYIKNNDLQIFNYEYVHKYNDYEITPIYDEKCGMYYVGYKGKKLYFSKKLKTVDEVIVYYRSILVEQDEKSPHRYLDKTFCVEKGDVVVDVGVAEGNFALDIIDKASKVYLVETDEYWVEALQQTFKDYRDKVVIIEKFATCYIDGKFGKLDDLIKEPINFLKMDIEGNEYDALLGAEQLISISPRFKCAVCCYHTDYDEVLIKQILEEYKIKSSTTNGYMWFPYMVRQRSVSTKLCRGIVRGIK